jgi:nickel-dependent lactate racemase
MVIGRGYTEKLLSEAEVRTILAEALAQVDLAGKRVIVIIPDGTRSGPVPLFFRLIHDLLGAKVAALDYLIALGTHMLMSAEAIQKRVGVTATDLAEGGRYAGVNNLWC